MVQSGAMLLLWPNEISPSSFRCCQYLKPFIGVQWINVRLHESLFLLWVYAFRYCLDGPSIRHHAHDAAWSCNLHKLDVTLACFPYPSLSLDTCLTVLEVCWTYLLVPTQQHTHRLPASFSAQIPALYL